MEREESFPTRGFIFIDICGKNNNKNMTELIFLLAKWQVAVYFAVYILRLLGLYCLQHQYIIEGQWGYTEFTLSKQTQRSLVEVLSTK